MESVVTIDLNRGWPCKEQLDLSLPLLNCISSDEVVDLKHDYRSYEGTGGITSAKNLFSQFIQVNPDEIYIGGTMSTSIMYDIINEFMFFGWNGNQSWKDVLDSVSFICPTPGYEKHFLICERFGLNMYSVPLLCDGPDLNIIEKLVVNDNGIRGIWCVPKYSNPTGTIYSQKSIEQLIKLCVRHENFYLFWDNAYCIHHLTDSYIEIANILETAKKYNVENKVFIFSSTSKITFPGGGVAFVASSKENIEYYTNRKILQLKTGDKINQLRHVRFLKNMENTNLHMKKHRDIILPKFRLVNNILSDRLSNIEQVQWNHPLGGYFILVRLMPHTAQIIHRNCLQQGILFTRPESLFPYGIDGTDQYIRIAPTHPSMEQLEIAITTLTNEILKMYKNSNFYI